MYADKGEPVHLNSHLGGLNKTYGTLFFGPEICRQACDNFPCRQFHRVTNPPLHSHPITGVPVLDFDDFCCGAHGFSALIVRIHAV
ncbi:hypothetical protein B0H12DRAFT_642812 [Mycena haematopus]|nr:hypothetical protein B0H12DRAFT_642812 [Mycena haematopus]